MVRHKDYILNVSIHAPRTRGDRGKNDSFRHLHTLIDVKTIKLYHNDVDIERPNALGLLSKSNFNPYSPRTSQ